MNDVVLGGLIATVPLVVSQTISGCYTLVRYHHERQAATKAEEAAARRAEASALSRERDLRLGAYQRLTAALGHVEDGVPFERRGPICAELSESMAAVAIHGSEAARSWLAQWAWLRPIIDHFTNEFRGLAKTDEVYTWMQLVAEESRQLSTLSAGASLP